MSLLSEGVEVGFEPHHRNQWRYLPQFCDQHYWEFLRLGKVRYNMLENPRRTPCDVRSCWEEASFQEPYCTRKRMGESKS